MTDHAPHVVLLRGINVGGRRRLPMKALAELIEEAGGHRPRTYIQSGNAVCGLRLTEDGSAGGGDGSAGGDDGGFAGRLAAAIEGRFGFAVPVVVRSADSWRAVPRLNPFPAASEDQLHVAFLADRPDPDRIDALDPERSPGDRFAVVGRDVYLHLTNGMARTRLTNAWLDRRLATISTGRNWRTVRAVTELLDAW